MYKVWRLGGSVLGIARIDQVALGGGVRWDICRPVYAWLNIVLWHIWFAYDRKANPKNQKEV
ncbi:MAG: hypothetical protein ACTSSA_13650 [Candidatus Freyarchaeota archaeon]